MTHEAQPHTVPVGLAQQLVELVQRWQVSPGEVLSAAGLDEGFLGDPLGRLALGTMCALLDRARTLTGEPGLGYYLGLQTRVSVYGYLGYAAQSARSLRDVLVLAMRYAPLFSTALSIDLVVDGPDASLVLEERGPLGSVRDIVLISMMLGLHTVGASLVAAESLGGAEPGAEQRSRIELAIPAPDYYPRFAHLVPETRFGQPMNRLIFDAKALDLPIATADPTALQLARKLCERALDELGFDAGLADRVRRLLPGEVGGFRSLEQVSALVHLSPRTLKRRLAAQGVSFSDLLDRERRETAMVLLRPARLPILDVARRLDYTTASAFTRAFRRWTGTTPAAYRRGRTKGATGS